MRAYLAIAVRSPGDRVDPALLAAARRSIAEAVPVPPDRWRTAERISPDGGAAPPAWTNEPSEAPFPDPILLSGDRALGYCGHLGGKGDADALLGADRLDEGVDLGGCFSVFRVGPDGMEAATSITRACPVYRAEAGGPRFAASAPRLAPTAAPRRPAGRGRRRVQLAQVVRKGARRHLPRAHPGRAVRAVLHPRPGRGGTAPRRGAAAPSGPELEPAHPGRAVAGVLARS